MVQADHYTAMTFKDDQRLRKGRLALSRAANVQPVIADGRILAGAWQHIGALLKKVSIKSGVAPEAALAVWCVESADLPFVRGRPVLRLECHKLWEEWGRENPARFDEHFEFGGRGGTVGASWTQHRFRTPGGDWQTFHGSQVAEYQAFALAVKLAGKEAACRASSFGGPQILGSNHGKIGYPDASSVFRAFGRSQRAQVLGFFDFCQSETLFPALKACDWHAFARVYNGPARVDLYAEKINDAYRLARCIVAGDGDWFAREETLLAFDHEGFRQFIAGLGLRHFSHKEFLFRGRENSMPSSPAYGLNRYPPSDLWPNIAPVARALDAFRDLVAAPVTLHSIYRTPAYNAAISGDADRQHEYFAAVDFQVKAAKDPGDLLQMMRTLRDGGIFKGYVGAPGELLHIDARGENIDED